MPMTQSQSPAGLPSSFLDTSAMEPDAAARAWIENIGVMFDIRFRTEPGAGPAPRAGGFVFGDMLVGSSRAAAQSFDRSRYRAARDGLSHYLLQFYTEGNCGARVSPAADWTRPGDLLVVDLSQPLATAASDFSNLNLVVPRRMLEPLLRGPDDHNLAIVRRENPLTGVLFSHLRALHMSAPQLTTGEAALLIRPTLELAAAALNGAADEATRDGTGLAQFTMICRHVDAHLFAADLSAGSVARRFGISTRKLYYLFEGLGGFATHVQEQRLRRARAALVEPANARRGIGEIARDHGFAHRSTFVAAFRRLFDMSPREMRQLGRAHPPPDASERRQAEWARWIAGMR